MLGEALLACREAKNHLSRYLGFTVWSSLSYLQREIELNVDFLLQCC